MVSQGAHKPKSKAIGASDLRAQRPPSTRTMSYLIQKYTHAEPFLMESGWRERLVGRLTMRDGMVVKMELKWIDPSGR